MINNTLLAGAINACPKETFRGTLYRAVSIVYFTTLTSGVGAFRAPNRYGRPNLTNALYLSTGPDLAMLEATRQYQHEFHTDPLQAFMIIPVRVNFRKVLDLTDPQVLPILGTSLQELTGDWRAEYARHLASSGTHPVPTHELGEFAFNTGCDAIKYPSAYQPNRDNYVHFLKPDVQPHDFVLPKEITIAQELLIEYNTKKANKDRREARKRQRNI